MSIHNKLIKNNFRNFMINPLVEGPSAIYNIASGYKKDDPNSKKNVLELLKEKNVNIRQEEHGFTAIHYASIMREVDIIRILIDAKIDVNVKDNAGFTAIHYASSSSERERNDEDLTVIELLLIAKGDPDAVSENGQTPLHIASKKNNTKAISSLLIGGANPNIADKNKRTPLHEVSAIGNFKAVKFLLIANATINVVDNFGNTPISLATKAGHDDIVKILQERAKANELRREESVIEISLNPLQVQNSDFLPSEKRITEDELREAFQAEVPLVPTQAFNLFSIYSQLELSEQEPDSAHCGIFDKSDQAEVPLAPTQAFNRFSIYSQLELSEQEPDSAHCGSDSKKEIPIKFNPTRRTLEFCAEEPDYSDLAKKTPKQRVTRGARPKAFGLDQSCNPNPGPNPKPSLDQKLSQDGKDVCSIS